jgi:hypothetical protein
MRYPRDDNDESECHDHYRRNIMVQIFVCEIILVWMHCYDMWVSATIQVIRLPKTK